MDTLAVGVAVILVRNRNDRVKANVNWEIQM